MELPRVTIIVPAYNSVRFIRDTIESVLAQTYSAWQLIVINDGSTDSTVELVQEYVDRDERIKLHSKENGGVVSALNRGLDLSKHTELVTLLGHDDVWEPDLLVTLVNLIDTDRDAVGAHGIARYIGAAGERVKPGVMEIELRNRRAVAGRAIVAWELHLPTTFDVLVCQSFIPASGVIVRRNILDRVGNFDMYCEGAEDWDMWLRLSQFGHFAFVDRVVYNYRLHDSNMSSNTHKMESALLRVYEKLLKSHELSSAQRRAATIGLRSHFTRLIRVRTQWARDCVRSGKLMDAAKQIRHAGRLYARSFAAVRLLRRGDHSILRLS